MCYTGFLIYKCRLCGKLDKSLHIPNGIITLCEIINYGDTSRISYNSIIADKSSLHSCKNGMTGVSDIVGFEEDKD